MPVDLVPVSGGLFARLGELGVDIARVLREANVPRSRLDAAKPRVTTVEFFSLWRALEEFGGRPDLGLRIGGDTLPHQLSVATMAALHSETLGDGLRRLARYKRLVCPEEITITVAGGEGRLRFEWLLAENEAPAMLIDGVFASVTALAQRGTGKRIVPKRIELMRRPAHEATLRK